MTTNCFDGGKSFEIVTWKKNKKQKKKNKKKTHTHKGCVTWMMKLGWKQVNTVREILGKLSAVKNHFTRFNDRVYTMMIRFLCLEELGKWKQSQKRCYYQVSQSFEDKGIRTTKRVGGGGPARWLVVANLTKVGWTERAPKAWEISRGSRGMLCRKILKSRRK